MVASHDVLVVDSSSGLRRGLIEGRLYDSLNWLVVVRLFV